MGHRDGLAWCPDPTGANYRLRSRSRRLPRVGLGFGCVLRLEASKGDITFVPPSLDVTVLDGLYITNF